MADQDLQEGEKVGPSPFSLDFPFEPPETDKDYEFFEERAGAVMHEKVLIPKSKNFDTITRADPEDDTELELCAPFDENMADEPLYPFPQLFKDEFVKSGFESEDRMYSSSIVGWTTEESMILFVNETHLGDLAEDIVPMSDTIFPVFVMGKNRIPVTPQVFDEDIMSYEPGVYLVLYDYPGMGSMTVQVNVDKHKSIWKFNVSTYKAQLELHLVYLLWKDESQRYFKNYRPLGTIDRILDKDNAAYGVYGMYGGGPLPPNRSVSYRGTPRQCLCWDQPYNNQSDDDQQDDYGLTSMAAGFRWDICYQKGARRVGYYCSRDALLVVFETLSVQQREGMEPDYKSLLKDYTFVICDGFATYSMYYGESNTENRPFKDLDNTTLGPIIAIVPEGVSSLNIKQSDEFLNCRNSMYFNENPALAPMVINWKRFQEDFEIEEALGHFYPKPKGHFRQYQQLEQIMKLRQLPDFVIFPIQPRDFPREYVFSLKQAPNYFPEQNRYDEMWNIYCRLSAEKKKFENRYYVYLGTISVSYIPTDGALLYDDVHFQKPTWELPVSAKYSNTKVHKKEREWANQMGFEFYKLLPDHQNPEFENILQRLPMYQIDQLSNPSINAYSRQKRLDHFSSGAAGQ